jgi:hypothetical protein
METTRALDQTHDLKLLAARCLSECFGAPLRDISVAVAKTGITRGLEISPQVALNLNGGVR